MSISPDRCQSLFRKAERDLLKLSSSQDPQPVHGFRTIARRVQTLLEEFVSDRSRKSLNRFILKDVSGMYIYIVARR